MHLETLRQTLRDAGARPCHEERVLRRWLQAQDLRVGRQRLEDFLPLALRERLDAIAATLAALARLRHREPAADGSERLVVALADGQAVESVLLPRGGLCLSTQVGCAVGCRFCRTGRDGLLRQLGSAEIAAQLALARTLRPVRKVVLMGMGEPAHNLDAVLEAIDAIGTLGGIGHKEIVFSTVGDRRAFDALPRGRVRPALALSLHSTDAARRARLLPRAPALAPAELVAETDRYARATGYPAQIQWTLLAGVNDGDDEFDALATLLQGRHAMLNLIPYNPGEGLALDGVAFARPSWERAVDFARALNRRGVLTRLRRSAGQDVEAGCGQLRARLVTT